MPRYAVEWNGEPVRDVDKAFRATVKAKLLEHHAARATTHLRDVAHAARHRSVAGEQMEEGLIMLANRTALEELAELE